MARNARSAPVAVHQATASTRARSTSAVTSVGDPPGPAAGASNGVPSSLTIVITPTPSAIVAPALTPDSATSTVSFASGVLSPRTTTENVFTVWPGENVRTAVAPPV